ncbi:MULTISPECIES: hypothetical protein [unclassified Microcoleus]|uniref:hypothetical protein n=1 Tax=unclassified Microcoleus TaxID=2642155 RepID=UPI002FCF5C2F
MTIESNPGSPRRQQPQTERRTIGRKRTKRKSLYRDAKAPEGRLATKTAAAMVA